MKRSFRILTVFLVLVMMFFPVSTLAFGNYKESYKKTFGDNSTNYVRTITGNACQVSDGVVVLSLSADLKVIDPIIDTLARKYDSDDAEAKRQARLVFFDLLENNIIPTITITKYDDNGKVLWEDKFTDGFSFYYGMVSDSDDNVYVIGLKGLKKYNKDGKLVSTNKDVKGYTIYKFGDYYAVFNAKLLELYDEYKNEMLSDEDKTSNTALDAEATLDDLKLRIIDGDESLFEVKFYDKDFKLVKKIDESEQIISINTQACIENNKLYYLTIGGDNDEGIINVVDSNFNVNRHEIIMADDDGYGFDYLPWPLLSTIEKTDTGFYIATLSNVFKIDSDYKATALLDNSFEEEHFVFITGMIKRGNNHLISYLDIEIDDKSSCKDDSVEDCIFIDGNVKVYDNNFNYLAKFDVNNSFGFKSAGLNNSITAITRIVNLNDGFMVLGSNIKSGYDFYVSAFRYSEYLEGKYNGETGLTPVTLTYPDVTSFLLRYGDGYPIKTHVVEGSGRVSVSKSFSNGNEKILYTVVPDAGYAVASLRVTTASGEEISVINNSFEMPNEEVVIYASFRKLDNPNTSAFAFIWILCFVIVGVASYMVFKPEKKSN